VTWASIAFDFHVAFPMVFIALKINSLATLFGEREGKAKR